MNIPERTLLRRLFLPYDITSMAPATKVLVYTLLILWLLVVLFPLYWLFITSFKLPVQVNDGPDFIPFIDFEPSLHAWHYIFFELGNDTFRPYLNSVIVAFCATVVCVLIGSFAAYALVRIQYRVKIGNVLAFLVLLGLTVYTVTSLGAPLFAAAPVAIILFVFFVAAVGRYFRRALGNDDILFWIISNRILPPVVVVLPVYLMFQRIGLLDTHIALIATYTAINLPIVVWLMRDFFAGIPLDLEESAQIDGASRLAHLLHHRAAAGAPGPRGDRAPHPHPRLERVPARALHLDRGRTDHAAARGGAERHARAAVVVHVGADRHHDRPIVLTAAILQRHIARGLLVGAIKG